VQPQRLDGSQIRAGTLALPTTRGVLGVEAGIESELAKAHRLFEQGDLTRSAWILAGLLDSAPDARALDRVESEVRLLRRQLMERAESSEAASARDGLMRFDQPRQSVLLRDRRIPPDAFCVGGRIRGISSFGLWW
jgi:hypothetical protein